MLTTSSASSASVIPFPARGTFVQQDDLFLASTTAPSTSIVGLIIKRVHTPCRTCGAVHFIIGSSAAMHYARLTCTECSAFAGWMSKGEFTFARMTIERSGMPTTPISEVKAF